MEEMITLPVQPLYKALWFLFTVPAMDLRRDAVRYMDITMAQETISE